MAVRSLRRVLLPRSLLWLAAGARFSAAHSPVAVIGGTITADPGTDPGVRGIEVIKQGDQIVDPSSTTAYSNHVNVGRSNPRIEAVTRRRVRADGTIAVVQPRTSFNQLITPIALLDSFSDGDPFITRDIGLTERIGLHRSVQLAREVFNVFNVANLTGYSGCSISRRTANRARALGRCSAQAGYGRRSSPLGCSSRPPT